MTTDTIAMTRRRLLGRVPAVAATTLAPVAFNAMGELPAMCGAMPSADPIIAAVIEHKGAFLMMESWYSGAWVECADDDPDGVTEDEVLERHYNAFGRLFTTRATTVAGVEFWLRHIASPGYGLEEKTIIANLTNFVSPFRETAIEQMLAMASVLRENA